MKQKNNKHILSKVYSDDYLKKLANDIEADFENRKQERRKWELKWQLAINFLMGNQYCYITDAEEIENAGKQYFWQEREVFNHIAPIVEARLAKLSTVRPTMSVLPASDDDKDIYSAKLSKSIIKSLEHKLGLGEIISEATKWSEICGTAFYKIVWNNNAGEILAQTEKGENIYAGDVDILAIPPYEIYPDSNACESIEDCKSIIHARAYSVDTIKTIWGVDVKGGDIDVFTLDSANIAGGLGYGAIVPSVKHGVKENYAVVIEKYEAPSYDYPNGRMIIECAGQILHIDELPFINKADGKRGFPFVRQVSHGEPGCFWGVSVIDRCIPIQRSYNAVKNRKHEFMNRISMGVLTVEDGSVDTDSLEDEGLCPGKILVYRQGSNPPGLMQAGNIPSDFTTEEQLLLNEFNTISGVSDIMRNSSYADAGVLSGTAIQLLIDQDDSRIKETTDQIKFAVRAIAKHAIRLYKQYAKVPRLGKLVGENGELETFYFNSSDISSDDIVFDTETEVGESLAQKRNMVFQLLNAGLLHDENGKISNRARAKILEILGFGFWESGQDINALHCKKADEENLKAKQNKALKVLEVDDHDIHIKQHTAYILSVGDNSDALVKRLMAHIKEHKQYLALIAKVELNEKGIN